MKFNKRIIKAISIKTQEVEGGEPKTTKKIKISVPKDGGGYEDIWPIITGSTKNADLVEKDAKVNVYLSEDKKFVNALYKWEPKEDAPADGSYNGVNPGSNAEEVPY